MASLGIRGKPLQGQSREIIYNVYKYFHTEADRFKKNEDQSVSCYFKKVQERVADATGISRRTLNNILNEVGTETQSTEMKFCTPKQGRPKKEFCLDMDDFDYDVVRRMVYDFHLRYNELPSIKALKAKLSDAINYNGSEKTLRKILQDMGFQYTKMEDNNKIVLPPATPHVAQPEKRKQKGKPPTKKTSKTNDGLRCDLDVKEEPQGGISDAHDSDSEDEVLAKVSLASRKQSVAGASAGTSAGNLPQDTQRCDACRGDVAGPRYVCVECPYTQCKSCEFKGAHAHHYMLRVPGPRPEEEVERIVRVIQMELADIMSGSQPVEEPEIIKTEIKVETEPDPLDGVCEDLEPAQRVPEQTTAAVDFEQEIDNSADSHSNLPSRKLTSASNKRMASPERAASAAKTYKLAAAGDGTVKTEEEEMQSYEEASGSNANGVTSDEKQTRPQRGKPGRQRKGSAAKKKVKQ